MVTLTLKLNLSGKLAQISNRNYILSEGKRTFLFVLNTSSFAIAHILHTYFIATVFSTEKQISVSKDFLFYR